jgi:hypothetical protein
MIHLLLCAAVVVLSQVRGIPLGPKGSAEIVVDFDLQPTVHPSPIGFGGL